MNSTSKSNLCDLTSKTFVIRKTSEIEIQIHMYKYEFYEYQNLANYYITFLKGRIADFDVGK